MSNRRSRGGQPGNLNTIKSLEYAHNIEERIDGRSLLAQGFASHRDRLLELFSVQALDDLDGIEREAVRRLVKRRVVRELAWGQLQTAYEEQNIDAYNLEVPKFQVAVDAEERTEALVQKLIRHHRERSKSIDIVTACAEAAREESAQISNEAREPTSQGIQLSVSEAAE